MEKPEESKIIGHLVDTVTLRWFHYDDKYNLWSCNCKSTKGVSLCLSQCNHLIDEGEYNKIRREVAIKRKELKLLESLTLEDLEEIKKK